MRLSVSQLIDRPPAAVWRFFAIDHVRNHPRWDPYMELSPLTDGPMRVGARIHRRHTRAGTPVEGVMEVVEFEPERAMAVVIRDETPAGPVEIHSRVTLEAIGTDQTELTAELELPGATAPMDPAPVERSVATIKALIEAESPIRTDR